MSYTSSHLDHNAPVSFRPDRVRMLVFLKRKQGISHEEFSRYWLGPHARLFMSLDIVKTNVVKYEQIHANHQHAAPAHLALPASDWDGIVLFDGESYEKLFAVFNSDEYKTLVLPDNKNFLDTTKYQVLLADLATFIDT